MDDQKKPLARRKKIVGEGKDSAVISGFPILQSAIYRKKPFSMIFHFMQGQVPKRLLSVRPVREDHGHQSGQSFL